MRIAHAVIAVTLTGHAVAQTDFPARPVRIIVNFATGGPSDIVARIVSVKLSEAWGKSVVVENVAGGGGNIGVERTVNATPDGYTILLSGSSPLVINPSLQHLPAGRPRALAVASRERSLLLKDVPTMIEAGIPDYDITGAMGLFAPAATPKEAIERLSMKFVKAAQNPDVKVGMLKDGFSVIPLGHAEYEVAVRAKVQQIQKIARAANMKVD